MGTLLNIKPLIGCVDGEFIPFPTQDDLEVSTLDLIVSGTKDAVLMIEGFAREMPEDTMAEAVAGHLKPGIKMVVIIGKGHIVEKFGVPDRAFQRTSAPFKTVYPVPVNGDIENSAADFLWVTPVLNPSRKKRHR